MHVMYVELTDQGVYIIRLTKGIRQTKISECFALPKGSDRFYQKSKNITVLKLINFQEKEDKSYRLSSTGGPSEKVCTIGYF